MIRLTILALAVTFALPALAGGPVVIREEPEVTAPERDRNLVPLILGLIVIGALIGGNSNGGEDPTDPCKKTDGGC